MRYCRKCLFPDTKPDLSFDVEGVCDACRSAEVKHAGVDWAARRQELVDVLDRYRNRTGANYDCVIPVSGGKDSTYQVHVIKDELGLKPLCVCWHPCQRTDLGWKNLDNLNRMGVDLVEVRANPHVYRKLAREGFIRVGDMEWPEHVGIFTAPVRVAVSYRIPMLVWGENSQNEYGGPAHARRAKMLDRRWLEEFGGLLGLRVEDFIGVDGLTAQDLLPWTYPSDEDLAAVGVTGIFLGYFLKWDARRQLEIVKKLGFQALHEPVEQTYLDYENVDCKYIALHDYLKWLKYGFGRSTDHVGIDIRNGRITREEAVRLVRKHEGRVPRKYLRDFLDAAEMTEAEFFRVLDKFTNTSLFVCDPAGNLVRDAEGNLTKRQYDNDDH
jgi:N-acetyl sugar amidotransferase